MSEQTSPTGEQAFLAWRVYLTAAALEALIALAALFRQPSEAGNELLFGLSAARLAIIAPVLALFTIAAWLLLRSWQNPARASTQVRNLAERLRQPGLGGVLLLLSGLGLAGSLFAISLAPEIQEPVAAALFHRLLPLFWLLAGICAQNLAGLFLIRSADSPGQWKPASLFYRQPAFWLTLAFGGLTFWLWRRTVQTTFKAESILTGWNELGAPLLELQVFLAWLVGMLAWGLLVLASRAARSTAARSPRLPRLLPTTLDLLIVLAIWFGTVLLWLDTPAPPSYFLSIPRQPNLEAYPNSDALVYDMSAQSLLIGQGMRFANDIYVRRPMLTLFLAGVHLLGGQGSAGVIFWQVAALALIPVLMFAIGKALDNRLTGVIAAVLVSLREATAIAASGTVTTTHVKLLMADVPAMLAMMLFVWVAVRGLQKRSPDLALLAGGLLGVAVLIRPELGAALLPTAGIAWLVYRKQGRQWLTHALLFSLGLFLLLAPWVYRNWSLTGLVFLDTPSFRTEWLEQRYRDISPAPPTPAPTPQPDGAAEPLPGSRTSAVANRQNLPVSFPAQTPPGQPTPTPLPTRPDAGAVLETMRSNAAEITRSMLDHYLNSQVQLFLTFPSTFRPLESLASFLGHRSSEKLYTSCCSALDYVRRLPYWRKWDGNLPGQAVIPITINLVLLAVGIQQSWRKAHWIGLLPAGVFFSHLLVNALARNSGGRYILSVDWIGLLYFGMGLATATLWVARLLSRQPLAAISVLDSANPEPAIAPRPRRSLLLLALALLALGSLAPFLERSLPARYTPEIGRQMYAQLMASESLDEGQKQSLAALVSGNGLAIAGRALYPRFYPANQGEPGSPDPLGPQPYPRLGFYLLERSYLAILLPQDEAPDSFKNGADVLVITCPDGQAAAVAIFDNLGLPPVAILLRPDNALPLSCRNQ